MEMVSTIMVEYISLASGFFNCRQICFMSAQDVISAGRTPTRALYPFSVANSSGLGHRTAVDVFPVFNYVILEALYPLVLTLTYSRKFRLSYPPRGRSQARGRAEQDFDKRPFLLVVARGDYSPSALITISGFQVFPAICYM